MIINNICFKFFLKSHSKGCHAKEIILQLTVGHADYSTVKILTEGQRCAVQYFTEVSVMDELEKEKREEKKEVYKKEDKEDVKAEKRRKKEHAATYS